MLVGLAGRGALIATSHSQRLRERHTLSVNTSMWYLQPSLNLLQRVFRTLNTNGRCGLHSCVCVLTSSGASASRLGFRDGTTHGTWQEAYRTLVSHGAGKSRSAGTLERFDSCQDLACTNPSRDENPSRPHALPGTGVYLANRTSMYNS
jgi:hypothetical protein